MTDEIKELENAVCDFIQIVKQIPELIGTRLAVTGGLALWHYLPDYRPTDNINFVTNLSALEPFESKLLGHPNSPFTSDGVALFYHSPTGRIIQINISPQYIFPTLCESAQPVHEIPYGEVPYVTREDLLLVKRKLSKSKNSNPTKRRRDAADAVALASHDVEGRFADGEMAAADGKRERLREAGAVGHGPSLSWQEGNVAKGMLGHADLMISSVSKRPPFKARAYRVFGIMKEEEW